MFLDVFDDILGSLVKKEICSFLETLFLVKMVDKGTSCGLFNWRPEWVQRFANQKVYMALFVIIGVVQSMAFSYLTVVLSTIEKRFGLKSKEATWIYSGNEISQIFFILFLPFVGKVKRRPLFMGLSIMLSSLGLFIIAIPHFTGEQTYLVDINQQVRCFIYLIKYFFRARLLTMAKTELFICTSKMWE